MNQKVVNYIIDGSGRDTYISYGNGGFYKSQTLKTDDSFQQMQRNSSLPRLNSKINPYHTDGTGRDTYISETSGGFYGVQPRINFMQNLRYYHRSPERVMENDFLRHSQMSKPIKEKARQMKLSQVVQSVTHRLVLPKIVARKQD